MVSEKNSLSFTSPMTPGFPNITRQLLNLLLLKVSLVRCTITNYVILWTYVTNTL